jgi:hypothetical protein
MNIIPQYTGLTINAISYEYTVVKNRSDNMIVNVQNKDTRSDSYIFRSSDDWSGLRGNSITKLVPVNNIPGTYWGTGEISVDGSGEVRNASVKYKAIIEDNTYLKSIHTIGIDINDINIGSLGQTISQNKIPAQDKIIVRLKSGEEFIIDLDFNSIIKKLQL